MRFHLLALVLVAGFLVTWEQAFAYEKYLGTLTSSGASVNNTSTGTPFTLPSGSGIRFALQCDAAAYVRAGVGAVVVSSSGANKGLQLSALQLFDVSVDGQAFTLAALSVSGTSNCDVFQVLP